MTTQFATFNAADYLDDEEVIAEYLSAAAEDENPDVLLSALAEVAKARGMSQVAAASGLGRESLYKALAPGAKPRYSTISAVMRALNVKFAVAPVVAVSHKVETKPKTGRFSKPATRRKTAAQEKCA
jgi:probable addiction module antidote protein